MNVQQTLTQAAALLGRNDFEAACRLGKTVLRTVPTHPGALQLVGIAYCQMGKPNEGLPYLRQSIKHGGDNPTARFNLARALMDAGELVEAEQLCGAVGQPPEMQRLYADILKAQGRSWEASSAYQQLVDANPDDAQAWNNLGNARHEMGELNGALAALQQARTLDPKSSQIHINLGRVLASLGRHGDGLALFQEAVRLGPRDPVALLEFGQALMRLDRSREALVALADAARIDAKNADVFVAMGLAFLDIEDRQRAEQGFKFAIQAKPDNDAAYLNLGLLLEQGNRVDELKALLRQATARGAKGSDLDYLDALSLRRDGKLDAALEKARNIYASSIDPAVRAHFIGQVADQLGQTELAFASFEEMHWSMAQSPLGQTLDRRAYQGEVENMAAVTTVEWFERWPAVTLPAEPQSPVFMVGFPRSGTTLADTLLLGHPGTYVLEEVPILSHVAETIGGGVESIGQIGEDDVVRVRARYFEELERVAPDAIGKRVIDKNPLSMLRAPLIHRLFPDAKIIFALRHPCDVVLSCFMQNFKLAQAMASFLDLTSGSLLYDRVMAYWEQCRSIFPLDIHTLRYESLVADVEGEMRLLLDFLNLPWDPAILDHQRTARDRGFIRTPSYGQVTEPVYARASGRWERYRPQLAEVLPILDPWVEKFGYGTTGSAIEETT